MGGRSEQFDMCVIASAAKQSSVSIKRAFLDCFAALNDKLLSRASLRFVEGPPPLSGASRAPAFERRFHPRHADVEGGRDVEGEELREQHAADHGDAERPPRFGAGAAAERA